LSTDQPDISLVIPAYNESGYLARTLEHVDEAREAYGNPSAIEVVVVDNMSTDSTAECARAHGARVLVEEKRCIAAVRNRGAHEASGRILAFLDADSLVSRNVFNSIRETMSSGRYVGGSTDVKLERMSVGLFVTMCLTVYPARWLLGVSGGLYFVERSAFDEVGGFDEGLYCAEDSAFLLALRKHAKRSGKAFRILKGDITTTSARSFDRFGDWYYVRNLPRIILNGGVRAFRSSEFCQRFWYDADR
jgi:glycosyltransferase involved in cell wall biosynthesis